METQENSSLIFNWILFTIDYCTCLIVCSKHMNYCTKMTFYSGNVAYCQDLIKGQQSYSVKLSEVLFFCFSLLCSFDTFNVIHTFRIFSFPFSLLPPVLFISLTTSLIYLSHLKSEVNDLF